MLSVFCVLFLFPPTVVWSTKLHSVQFPPSQDTRIIGITVRGKVFFSTGNRAHAPETNGVISNAKRILNWLFLSSPYPPRMTILFRPSRKVPCCSASMTNTWTWSSLTRTLTSHSGPWRTLWKPSVTNTSGYRSTGSTNRKRSERWCVQIYWELSQKWAIYRYAFRIILGLIGVESI